MKKIELSLNEVATEDLVYTLKEEHQKEYEEYALTIPPIWSTYELRKMVRETDSFKSKNSLWNRHHMGSGERVGWMIDFIDVHKPKSLKEFSNLYLTHVMTWDEMQQQAKEWADIAGLRFDEALAHHIIHVIDESWEGHKGEEAVIEYYEKMFQQFSFAHTTAEDDREYAIDLYIYNVVKEEIGGEIVKIKNQMVGAIQIKPASFFKKGVAAYDKAKYRKMQDKWSDLTGLPVYYTNIAHIGTGMLPTMYSRGEIV